MKLILSLACDDARVRPDGKVDVSGIFNELSAPGFPATQERMTVVFIVEWEDGELGRRPLRADLLDESGRAVLTIKGHTDVELRDGGTVPAHTRLIMPLQNVVFPEPGRYHFRLDASGSSADAFSLFLHEDAGD